MDCTDHVTGEHKKDADCFAETFFDTMDDLDAENKPVDVHIFDGASVCRKAQKILKVVYPMLSFIFRGEHTCHNVFQEWESIEEINKLCTEDKVCLIGGKIEFGDLLSITCPIKGFTYLCRYKRLWNVPVTSQVVTRSMPNFLRRVYLIQ